MNGSNHLDESESRPFAICPVDLRKLQLESLSTHHPAKREQRFFDWLTANGGVCSLRHLIQVKNQMTVWLGTAAGSKRIDLSLEKLLQASQTNKTPG